jgi:hypothetical protein
MPAEFDLGSSVLCSSAQRAHSRPPAFSPRRDILLKGKRRTKIQEEPPAGSSAEGEENLHARSPQLLRNEYERRRYKRYSQTTG